MNETHNLSGLGIIDPDTNVRRLERFHEIESLLMRMQGARLPDLSTWNIKQQIGHFLYQDSQHADGLRSRRLELRAGKGSFTRLDPQLERALTTCLFGEDEYIFLTVLFLGIKTELLRAYQATLEQTRNFSDYPTYQVLRQVIAEEQQQIAWMQGALALMPNVTPESKRRAQEWVANLRAWIGAAGGVLGEAGKTPSEMPPERTYHIVRHARRDPRQIHTFEFDLPEISPDPVEQTRFIRFAAYFREMAAAETVAALLWQAPREMPWEFYMDTARHFWDEIRHCQMGQERLESLGIDIWKVPVQTGYYDSRAHMPPLESYTFLTQVQEAESFAIKKENAALLESAGDRISADMIGYEMADERNHVRYGTKWIPVLQKHYRDERSLRELVADARRLHQQVWKELSGKEGDPDGQF